MNMHPDIESRVKALQIANLERAKARASGANENQAQAVFTAAVQANGTGYDPVGGLACLLFIALISALYFAAKAVDSFWPFAVIPAMWLFPHLRNLWRAMEGSRLRVPLFGGALALVGLLAVLVPLLSASPKPQTEKSRAANSQTTSGTAPTYSAQPPAPSVSFAPPPAVVAVVPAPEPSQPTPSAPSSSSPDVTADTVATDLPAAPEPQAKGPWTEPRFKVVQDLLAAAVAVDLDDPRWLNQVEGQLVAYAPNGRSPRMGDRIESDQAVTLGIEAATKKDMAGSVPFLRRAVELDPSNTDAILALATALHILKRSDEGATVLMDALLSDPANEYLWYTLSEVSSAVLDRSRGAMLMAAYLAPSRQKLREMLRKDYGSWPVVMGTLMSLERLPSRRKS